MNVMFNKSFNTDTVALAIMRSVLAFIVQICVTSTCLAQVVAPEVQLPNWAAKQLTGLAKSQFIEISLRINPFVLRGDFDGDGRTDLAVMIKNTKSKKEGIAFLFSGAHKPIIVGAGQDFGNGGDDFSWLDLWYVEDKATHQRGYYEKAVTLNADGLVVAKAESASALIYFRAGKLVWQQQGD